MFNEVVSNLRLYFCCVGHHNKSGDKDRNQSMSYPLDHSRFINKIVRLISQGDDDTSCTNKTVKVIKDAVKAVRICLLIVKQS